MEQIDGWITWITLSVAAAVPPESSGVGAGEALAGLMLIAVLIAGISLWLSWLLPQRFRLSPVRIPLCFQADFSSRAELIPTSPVVAASFWIAVNLFFSLVAAGREQRLNINDLDFNTLFVNAVLLPVGVAGFVLLLWKLTRPHSRLSDYFRVDEWRNDLQAGLELFLLALPPTLLLGLVSQLWRRPENLNPLLQILENSPTPALIGLIFVSAALVAPLIEELLFRVLLLNGLVQHGRLAPGLAVFVSAAVFSLAHGPYDALQLMPLALGLGYCLVRRQRYFAVVATHLFFNSFMLTLALLPRL